MDLSSNQTKLHRALPAGQDPPATPAHLAEATGLGYSTVTRLLRELAEAGHAVKAGPGWRATGPAGHPDPRHEPDHGATDPDPDSTNPDADATDTSDTDEPAEAPMPPSGPAAAPPVAGPATGEGSDDPGPGVDAGGEPVAGDTAARGDDPDDDGVEPVPPVADGDPAPGRGRLRKGELPKQVLAALREHRSEALSPHRLTKLIGARSSGAVGNACDALVKAGLAELATDRPRTFRATTAD